MTGIVALFSKLYLNFRHEYLLKIMIQISFALSCRTGASVVPLIPIEQGSQTFGTNRLNLSNTAFIMLHNASHMLQNFIQEP
jgi:hypothetical protein